MTLSRSLLFAFVSLSVVGCTESQVTEDDTEDTMTPDTDGATGGSSGEDPADTEGWESPELDLGSNWEPTFECDDPNAVIPEGVECEDAVPGDQAPESDQAAVKEEFGEECELERMCGDQWGVNCMAPADGPYYYVDPETLEVVATCGGACWVEACEDCPPEGWVCPML